jgi:hypothetical protein
MALTLAWVSSANAIAISLSFTDLIPGADIVVGGVPGINGVPALPVVIPVAVSTTPELATVSFGNVTGTGVVVASVALTEPGQPSVVSDLISIRLFELGAQVAFQSDAETGLTIPPGQVSITTFLTETGLPQIAFSTTVLGVLDLTISTQSDLDNGLAPVPEPSTLLLFGSSLAGIGAVWRRYRHT